MRALPIATSVREKKGKEVCLSRLGSSSLVNQDGKGC
jgi:hypothetical protein